MRAEKVKIVTTVAVLAAAVVIIAGQRYMQPDTKTYTLSEVLGYPAEKISARATTGTVTNNGAAEMLDALKKRTFRRQYQAPINSVRKGIAVYDKDGDKIAELTDMGDGHTIRIITGPFAKRYYRIADIKR